MKYANLTKAEKATVRRNFRRMGGIRFVGFSQGYDLVSGPDEMLRGRASIEYAGEDAALPYWARAKMINFARQGMRNGDSLRGLVKQMELNVVGTVGGRATFAFPDRTAAAKVRGAFAAWARECEFADDLPLSEVLRLVVTTKFLGGDMVLLFDDGSADRSGVRLDLRPDILHVGRLRRFALIVGILAAGDHSDRGNSENDAELVHFLFILLS